MTWSLKFASEHGLSPNLAIWVKPLHRSVAILAITPIPPNMFTPEEKARLQHLAGYPQEGYGSHNHFELELDGLWIYRWGCSNTCD